jgi:hypothetical protein
MSGDKNSNKGKWKPQPGTPSERPYKNQVDPERKKIVNEDRLIPEKPKPPKK